MRCAPGYLKKKDQIVNLLPNRLVQEAFFLYGHRLPSLYRLPILHQDE